MTGLELLLQPIQLGPLTVRNRLMMTTNNPRFSDVRYLDYLEERVAAGVGMVGIPILHGNISSLSSSSTGKIDRAFSADEDAAPDPSTEEGAAFYDELLIPRLKSRADIAHRHGAVCFGQVADRGAARLADNFQPRIAPSAIPDDQVRDMPHELSVEEIARVVGAFGRSAARIKKAGLDGIEMMGAHGYLIEQFLSPHTNRRTDSYGGTLHNRMRFLEEIMQAIRTACGNDFPVGMRLTAQQHFSTGLVLEEAREIAAALGSRVTYINVTRGTFFALQGGVTLPYVAPSFVPVGINVEVAAAIKAVASAPVIVTGRLNDPELMGKILSEGKADMIGVTRALMADPEFLKKIASGQAGKIRKCIGANDCHYPEKSASCAVNATLGREREMRFMPSVREKRVLVIGGGPAGMEAARVAAMRGHRVTLLERENRLGGQIAIISGDANRAEFAEYLAFLGNEIEDQKVTVELGIQADADTIRRHAPDALVLATGSTLSVPDFADLPGERVYSALDVLKDSARLGSRVLVVGGLEDHLGPTATAEFIADTGRQVTLITSCLLVAQGLEPATMHLVLKRLLDKSVDIHTLTELVAWKGAPVVRNVFTRKESTLHDVDSIVFAYGRRVNNELADTARRLVKEVYEIGDCLAPRRLIHATLDGARVGRRI